MYRNPILQMGRSLLVTIQVDMEDQTALRLQDDLAEKIMTTRATGVLIDISALEIVDSFVGRMLAGISGIARILDATTVVVGPLEHPVTAGLHRVHGYDGLTVERDGVAFRIRG